MEFDHVPERGKKLRHINRMWGASAIQLRTEIAKCDVVCANCHRIRTHNRRIGEEDENGD